MKRKQRVRCPACDHRIPPVTVILKAGGPKVCAFCRGAGILLKSDLDQIRDRLTKLYPELGKTLS